MSHLFHESFRSGPFCCPLLVGDEMNVFKALIIVICVICIAESLSLGEKECISDFLSAWPDLGSLVPPWTSNASSACDNPPFKGITCTEGPEKHVIGLYDRIH